MDMLPTPVRVTHSTHWYQGEKMTTAVCLNGPSSKDSEMEGSLPKINNLY